MTKVDLQYDILNYTPASASPVEANLDRLEQHINQEVVERDGTVAMRAQLKLVGDPVSELDAAPKQYVDGVLPIGIIMMFGGSSVPPGGRWAVCNGAELESATYPLLFSVIGTNFSPAGTPAGRFNLPNLTDRFPVGSGAIAAMGKTGGSKDSVVPTHSHEFGHTHTTGWTGGNNVGHRHIGGDHLHRVDIWSGGQNADHAHGSQAANGQFMTYGVGGAVKAGSGSTIPFVGPYHTGGVTADHAHPINGHTSGVDRDITTSYQDANHQHPFDTPSHVGRTSTEGVAVTDANLPPFIGVAYIMRVR